MFSHFVDFCNVMLGFLKMKGVKYVPEKMKSISMSMLIKGQKRCIKTDFETLHTRIHTHTHTYTLQ